MARPIKETPILTGKDAERFIKRMNETRIVSEKEIKRVKKNYEYILSEESELTIMDPLTDPKLPEYANLLFELRKAKEKAHIWEALQTAVDFIDEVINIIRSSADTP